MTKKPNKKSQSTTIALNKRTRHDFHLDDRFEAGLMLEGWEVKSLRAGMGQLIDTYVHLKDGEAWLINAHISPLKSTSTHIEANPTRIRKLLLHERELTKIFAAVNKKGYTCVATALYWKGHLVKCEIALAKGKQDYDKRETEKGRDWERQKQRIMRHGK